MTHAISLPETLSQWSPASTGPHSLTAPSSNGQADVTVTAERVDPIGALVRDISVHRKAGESKAESLPDRAHRVATTTRGLSENLRVLEVDATREQAVLRSDVPAEKPDGKHYYEVVLTGRDQAEVKRYRATPGQARAAVPFPLTHETIGHLADVLAE